MAFKAAMHEDDVRARVGRETRRASQRTVEDARQRLTSSSGTRADYDFELIDEYANDESIPYLLKRLRDVADRFRPLFASDSEFDAFFPQLSTRTDLEAARAQEAVAQLGLFG